MDKSVAELMAEATAGDTGKWRKLTFREQCGAFAALYGGQKNYVVAEAFGLGLASVSHLSGCLKYDPDPYRYELEDRRSDGTRPDLMKDDKVLMDHNRNRDPERRMHYQDVRREFEALGVERFNDKYYRPYHDRIMQAKSRLDAARIAKKRADVAREIARRGL